MNGEPKTSKSDVPDRTRRIDSPNCSTCRHFLPGNPSYPACSAVNVREGWGALSYMPTEPEDVCHQHETREPANV